ncbi:MAG: lipoprotein signal peptidase [Bacteroidetes bacterium]|nr:MAG: lipoprotein signal peptidase [Bacteroidota bacterium]
MKKKLFIVLALVILILTADQIIKIWVKSNLTVYDEAIPLIGSWFRMIYIENQGMAFGTTFGGGSWTKLALSIFRIIAILGIAYYWLKQARAGMKLEFLIALGLIFAGATGNLIDSMFYDFIFADSYDPCLSFNLREGSGIECDCGIFGLKETRPTGFLYGNVVDMFQFHGNWPEWVPGLGGKEIFPAIWNMADASISCGVVMILFRQRNYFPRNKKKKQADPTESNV